MLISKIRSVLRKNLHKLKKSYFFIVEKGTFFQLLLLSFEKKSTKLTIFS